MLDLAAAYPRFRYMGSKHRLLPWLSGSLAGIEFDSALDAFSGSGCVAYLMKTMGKRVSTNDFMNFSATIARAFIQNSDQRIDDAVRARLKEAAPRPRRFIQSTFKGIFFQPEDLQFLDDIWSRLVSWEDGAAKSLVLTALIRSCMKRQPRGVFTVAGDPEQHKDGRRDLKLSLAEHFEEQIEVVNEAVFDNGRTNQARCGDVYEVEGEWDLVYLDPPYVPRADDNCYMKRYHFLEGLSDYWNDGRADLMTGTKVKKLPKRYTPFSYRREAGDAFARLFARFEKSTIALSYSSNGYPDLDELKGLLSRYKAKVSVMTRPHRYSFGNHAAASSSRRETTEYLLIGT